MVPGGDMNEQSDRAELERAIYDGGEQNIPTASADEPVQETMSVCGVINSDGRYLMGKRKPGGSLGGCWEFIGGKVNMNEAPGLALKREFQEELGVDIALGPLFYRGSFQHNGTHFTLQAYKVELLSDDFTGVEHEALEWKTVPEMKELRMASSDYGVYEYLKYHPEEWS